MAYVPQRGDVVRINFNPQSGHEQAGVRPALVVSPRAYNAKTGLALLCPLTNQIKGYPFEITVPDGEAVTGAVLCDQVKSLDWRARNARFVATLPGETTEAVLENIRLLLD